MEMINKRVLQVWREIEENLFQRGDAPMNMERLLPPMSEEQIADQERMLGVELPLEYKESLRIHEGAKHWALLWQSTTLLSATEVVGNWENIVEISKERNAGIGLIPIGAVQGVAADAKWIPVASENGIPLCLDMNPAQGGNVGQVICVDWEDGAVKVIARDFLEFLENGLQKMKV